MHWFAIKVKKLNLGNFLPNNPNVGFFQKKSSESILSCHTNVTLCKYSEYSMY